jgi:hypothetical protein
VGQRADGRVLLVTVDGDQPGYSVGMTTFELALTMARLGCVTASGLGAGDAATAAFDGQLLNRPSGSGETPVADALLVLYTGVYAPPAAEPVLSPNGDSIADRQTLAYRLVRPADVAATLIAPDGSARQLDVGRRGAGTYTFPWTGTTSAGTPEAEGVWRFSVTAVDDAGERSAADRYFSLNDTLGFLRASPDVLRLGHARLRASFQLAHPARVTANVETQSGLVIRILVRRDLDPGTYSLVWTGRGYAGRLAFGGRYVLRVAAVNGFGRVDLSYAFSARR